MYFDKTGREIKAGMVLRHDDNELDTVCTTTGPEGQEDLGILATNPKFLCNHPGMDTEYYPLSRFPTKEWEIVNDKPFTLMELLTQCKEPAILNFYDIHDPQFSFAFWPEWEVLTRDKDRPVLGVTPEIRADSDRPFLNIVLG